MILDSLLNHSFAGIRIQVEQCVKSIYFEEVAVRPGWWTGPHILVFAAAILSRYTWKAVFIDDVCRMNVPGDPMIKRTSRSTGVVNNQCKADGFFWNSFNTNGRIYVHPFASILCRNISLMLEFRAAYR